MKNNILILFLLFIASISYGQRAITQQIIGPPTLQFVTEQGNVTTLGAFFGDTVSGSDPIVDQNFVTKAYGDDNYLGGTLSYDGSVNNGVTVNFPVGGDALSASRTKIVSNISIVITSTADAYIGSAKWVAFYTWNGGTPEVNYSTIHDSTPANISWNPLLVSFTAMVRLLNNTGATVEYMVTYDHNE